MANSFVQQRSVSGTGNSVSLAFTSNNAAGNLLVLQLLTHNISLAGVAVSDTKNGTWTQAVSASFNNSSLATYYFSNCGAGANTVTASVTSSGSSIEIVILEFSGGGNTSWGLRTSAHNSGSSGTAVSPGAMTVVVGDVCVSYGQIYSTSPSGAAGWTYTTTPNTNGTEYKIATGTSETGSFTQSGSNFWFADSAAFYSQSSVQSISASGIASTTAFGNATVSPGVVNIAPGGVASTTAFGSSTLSSSYGLNPNGIGSSTAFGSATVSAGPVNVAPSGVPSTTAFGLGTLSSTYGLSPSGIGSITALGSPAVLASYGLNPSGIGSITALGTAAVSASYGLNPSGIGSITAFGSPVVSVGTVNISPAGISSTIGFGNTIIAIGWTITAIGIGSTNAFGLPVLTKGPANISPLGIGSTNAFGNPSIGTGSVNISSTGIGSTNVFGNPSISFNVIAPAGIASVTAFGVPSIFVQPVNPVPPYTGDPQQDQIDVPAQIQYREDEWEEGPWAMPPYGLIFPQPSDPQPEERGSDHFHHQWLKTHPRPPGPRRLGDNNHRPQSVLPPLVRTQPIMIRPKWVAPVRRMSDPGPPKMPEPRPVPAGVPVQTTDVEEGPWVMPPYACIFPPPP